jgi:hypothetical protein
MAASTASRLGQTEGARALLEEAIDALDHARPVGCMLV